MRVDWAIICRYVEVNNGLATIVGGGLDVFTVVAVPVELPITIALRAVGLPDANEHTLEVLVIDPMMAPAGEAGVQAKFTMAANPNHPPGWELNLTAPIIVNVPIEQAGTYTIDIKVDGHSHTMPFRVDVASS